MPWNRTLECPDCGHQWVHLAMSKGERNPPCSICSAKPVAALAAPAIGRGAQPDNRIKVPDSKTKAIDFAQRMISDDNMGANMQTKSRVGEAVAIAPTVAPHLQAKWGSGVGSGSAPMSFEKARTMAAADPLGGSLRNGLMDKMGDRKSPFMQPVYRDQRKA